MPRPPRVPAKTGLNMFAWNMRYPDASGFDNLIMWAANVNGPIAPPGRYTVRLTVGSETQSQPLIIKADPRSTATPAGIAGAVRAPHADPRSLQRRQRRGQDDSQRHLSDPDRQCRRSGIRDGCRAVSSIT